MAEIRTVTTLTKKRDEIARAIIGYERKLAQARADLSHVNATLASFWSISARRLRGRALGRLIAARCRSFPA
jgi:hypothetical protein